jgi:hypothetical protein
MGCTTIHDDGRSTASCCYPSGTVGALTGMVVAVGALTGVGVAGVAGVVVVAEVAGVVGALVTVAGRPGLGLGVGGHGAGSKYGSVIPSATSRNTARTGIPTRTSSGGQPVMPVISRGPSASSTSAST